MIIERQMTFLCVSLPFIDHAAKMRMDVITKEAKLELNVEVEVEINVEVEDQQLKDQDQ